MTRIFAFALIFAFIVILSCSDNKPTGPGLETPPSDVIMPLAVGNSWEGTYKYISPVEPYDTLTADIYISLPDSAIKYNIIWYGYYFLNSAYPGIYYPDGADIPCIVTRLANRKDGLWIYGRNMCDGTEYMNLLIKYPAQVGDEFLSGPNNQTVKLVSITAVDNVPECEICPDYIYKYAIIWPEDCEGCPETYMYYSPGWGEIKWESFNGSLINSYHCWEIDKFYEDGTPPIL